MKTIQRIASFVLIVSIMASFSQCGNAQYSLEKSMPSAINLEKAYYQVIPPGIREGDTHVTVVVPITEGSEVVLDSVFFRGQRAKFEEKEGTYTATLIEPSKEKYALEGRVGEPNQQTSEQEAKKEAIPFDLEPNECVLSYREAGALKYVKIDQIAAKPLKYPYPMAPNSGDDIKQ